jgi:hypothetical protein
MKLIKYFSEILGLIEHELYELSNTGSCQSLVIFHPILLQYQYQFESLH